MSSEESRHIDNGIKSSSFTRNAYVATSRETRCCTQVVKANSSTKWDAKLGVPLIKVNRDLNQRRRKRKHH